MPEYTGLSHSYTFNYIYSQIQLKSVLVYHQYTHWQNQQIMCRHAPAYTGIVCRSHTGLSHLLSFNLNYIFKLSWNQFYDIWLVYFYNLYTISISTMPVRNWHTMCWNTPAYTGTGVPVTHRPQPGCQYSSGMKHTGCRYYSVLFWHAMCTGT